MAKARDPNRDKAFEVYKEHEGNITNRAIAEMLGVLEKTISAWKSRDKWLEQLKGDDCSTTKNERSTTKKEMSYCNEENVQQDTTSSEKVERKRGGNPNPVRKFTERNQAALKHGLYSRYIPQETLEIMGMLDEQSPADIIWSQIQIQYAAIIRSQSIMFVESKDEMIKELKKFKPGEYGDEQEWNFQFAWERQAQLLNAQSRAIGELRTAIKQFIVLAAEDDERKLKAQQMQLSIEKTKEETERLRKLNEAGNQQNTEEKLAEYFTALQGVFTNEHTDE